MKDAVDLLNERIAELENQITEIPQICRRYDKRIAALEAEVERLRGENAMLLAAADADAAAISSLVSEVERLGEGE